MATGGSMQRHFPSNRERTNYAKLCRIIIDLGTEILRQLLLTHASPPGVAVIAHRCPRKSLHPQQWTHIFNARVDGYVHFDITLLYTLLRNVGAALPPPGRGWGGQTLPGPTEVDVADDIERIRIIRNEVYGHLSNTMIDNTVYQGIITELKGVMGRFDQRLGSTWCQELDLIDTDCMDDESESRYIGTIETLAESDRELRRKIEALGGQFETLEAQMTSRLGEIDIRVDNLETDIRGQLGDIDNRVNVLESDVKGLRCRLTPEAMANKGITHSLIDLHKTDKTFLCTKATEAGVEYLDRYGIAIYKGTAGSGKTANAKQVMTCMQSRNEEVLFLKLTDIGKWDSCVNPDIKSVVLLDDCLGKTNLNDSVLSDGGDIWTDIYACVRTGNVKVLMTIRSNILDEALSKLEIYDLFDNNHVIDLSSETFKLTPKNKRDLLVRHCSNNNISFCSDVNEENIQSEACLDKNIELKLSDDTVNDIIHNDPFLGFPQSCFLFCKDRKYTRLGINFFKHPTDAVIQEIEKLRKSKNTGDKYCYCVLVYMLLHNQIDLNILNTDLLESIGDKLDLSREIRLGDIDDAINEMKYIYLVQVGGSEIYEFRHQTILESVAISSVRQMPEIVLDLCPLAFIYEFIRTQNYNGGVGEVMVKLRVCSYASLIKRFLFELKNGNAWFVSHVAMDDLVFLSHFFEYIKKDPDCQKSIKESCEKEGGMLMIACMFGKSELVKQLCSLIDVSRSDVMKGAQHAAKCGHVTTLMILWSLSKCNLEIFNMLVGYIKNDRIAECLRILQENGQGQNIVIMEHMFRVSCLRENLELAKSIFEKFSRYLKDNFLLTVFKNVPDRSSSKQIKHFISSQIRKLHSGESKNILEVLKETDFHEEIMNMVNLNLLREEDIFKELTHDHSHRLPTIMCNLSSLRDKKYIQFILDKHKHNIQISCKDGYGVFVLASKTGNTYLVEKLWTQFKGHLSLETAERAFSAVKFKMFTDLQFYFEQNVIPHFQQTSGRFNSENYFHF